MRLIFSLASSKNWSLIARPFGFPCSHILSVVLVDLALMSISSLLSWLERLSEKFNNNEY